MEILKKSNQKTLLQNKRKKEKGYSLISLIVTIGITSILTATVVPNIKILDQSLELSASQLVSTLKLARMQAVSKTKSFIVRPISEFQVNVYYTDSCSDTSVLSLREDLSYILPNKINLVSTDWAICYNSRGFSNSNSIVHLHEVGGQTLSVEVGLAGGSRVL